MTDVISIARGAGWLEGVEGSWRAAAVMISHALCSRLMNARAGRRRKVLLQALLSAGVGSTAGIAVRSVQRIGVPSIAGGAALDYLITGRADAFALKVGEQLARWHGQIYRFLLVSGPSSYPAYLPG